MAYKNFSLSCVIITCIVSIFSCKKETEERTEPNNTTRNTSSKPHDDNSNKPSDNQPDLGTELEKALRDGAVDKIAELAQKGVDLNANLKSTEMPPIHSMVYGGLGCTYSKEILLALINNGADVNKQITKGDWHDEAPINQATNQMKLNLVADLLEANANPNIVGDDGAPLHQAIKIFLSQKSKSKTADNVFKIIFKLLTSAGINLNLADKDGHVPLYYANFASDGTPLSQEEKDDLEPVTDLFLAKCVSFNP